MKTAYNWVWKWHFIGGLISFPFVFVLAITGFIYLFKANYEKPQEQPVRKVEAIGTAQSFEHQRQVAQQSWDREPTGMILPQDKDQATEFVTGRFSSAASLFVDPYLGKVTGAIAVKETDMYKVRKLHGELLTGSFGTKIVELIGCWLVVLIITGLYLFFPRDKNGWKHLFRIRFKGPKNVMFRDLHVFTGFWFSVLLLMILAGGLPWTDVWGAGFKWVQDKTHTGYPADWTGTSLQSEVAGEPIKLDQVVDYAHSLDLPGEVTISFPKSEKGVYSIQNTYYKDQNQQVTIHLDQYSGQPIKKITWSEVGVLIRARMWVMAFHQGQFGLWNWLLVLVTALALAGLSLAAILSFFIRKKKGSWGVPPKSAYHVGAGFYLILGLLMLMLPLFGISVVLIFIVEMLRNKQTKQVV